jgi:hypothetical protein
MGKERTVTLTRRRIEYYDEEVNLLDFLKRNVCELYISKEQQELEIRVPTRESSHYVAGIKLCDIDSLVIDDLKNERFDDILERHVDDIIWSGDVYQYLKTV